MPRGKNLFHHDVKWAIDAPDVNKTYGARVQSVGMKRGKLTYSWSIFRLFKQKVKRRKGATK